MAMFYNALLQYSPNVSSNNVLLFTANSDLKTNGELVMGKGNAQVVRDMFPGIAAMFGKVLQSQANIATQGGVYGLRMVQYNHLAIGAFQTKISWQKPALMDVISYSAHCLDEVAKMRPDLTFHLPFPGTGNGGLSIQQVLPVLQALPNNVYVYQNTGA